MHRLGLAGAPACAFGFGCDSERAGLGASAENSGAGGSTPNGGDRSTTNGAASAVAGGADESSDGGSPPDDGAGEACPLLDGGSLPGVTHARKRARGVDAR